MPQTHHTRWELSFSGNDESLSINLTEKDGAGLSREATEAWLSALITMALIQSNGGASQTQWFPLSYSSPAPSLACRADRKALQFLKQCRAQFQISAQVLIWPPNGIIQTPAFIAHMNERAEPGHPCSRTHPPTNSKEGLKIQGIEEEERKGRTFSCNPLLYPSLSSSARTCFCSHQSPHSILIRAAFCFGFLRLRRLNTGICHLKGEKHKAGPLKLPYSGNKRWWSEPSKATSIPSISIKDQVTPPLDTSIFWMWIAALMI